MNAINYWKVEPYISDLCKVVLTTLIEKKEKKDHADKQMKWWGVYSSLMGALAFIYVFGFKWNEAEGVRTAVMSIASDRLIWFMALYFVLASLQWKRLNKQHEKACEEFENLRKEMIDRGEELWPQPDRQNYKHQVLTYMSEAHNINLYYK
ncbi:hypothetical protein A374_03274 [Fictibacillus macauensis ZFHKF-1]|uniref:DUF2663 family protein n=1 Tax=Fictibacillus macauensis ZFHKF-1 TaxID=1196324 RepID=I8ALQ9_9BACL|nr:DUF2663 family protein [Fictibacillus macauensis]EIT86559.1 hypothetical protein A374_03274 [Fictibacillus macauensis ZFHKF-1]